MSKENPELRLSLINLEDGKTWHSGTTWQEFEKKVENTRSSTQYHSELLWELRARILHLEKPSRQKKVLTILNEKERSSHYLIIHVKNLLPTELSELEREGKISSYRSGTHLMFKLFREDKEDSEQ